VSVCIAASSRLPSATDRPRINGAKMKTNDLIAAITADQEPDASPVERTIVVATLIGAVVTGAVFLLSLGWRPDIGMAIGTIRFPFKFVVTLAVLMTAASVVVKLARPGDPSGRQIRRLWAGPALILAGVAVELLALPPSEWLDRLLGTNALLCMTMIPLLSIAPLAGLLFALKRGAPTRPALAGAIAGLLSASIGATLYAAHCVDDSPLFVVVWYSLAMGVVTLVAARLGARLLRW
jgi:hypothetical protein